MSGRIDPDSNSPESRSLLQKLETVKNQPFGELLAICHRYPTFYGIEYQPAGVRVLKGENINGAGEIEDVNEPSYIDDDTNERFPLTVVEEGDLVMSVRGEVGKVGLISEEFVGSNLNANTIRLALKKELKEETVEPKFVWQFLNSSFGRQLIKRVVAGGVQETITVPDIYGLPIPTPTIETQKTLIAEMDVARASRNQKLAQAGELLNSLDGWLLEQFGFSPLSSRDNEAFAVQLADLKLQRLDPFFYTPNFLVLDDQLQNSSHKVVTLGSQLKFAPMNGVDSRNYLQSGQRYLRVQNIRPFEVDVADARFVLSKHTKNVALQSGDVLLTRKGTFGVAAPVTKEFEGDLISSEIMLLRLSETAEFGNDYLVSWLSSSFAKSLLNRYKTGGIMGHVTQDIVSNFPVPVLNPKLQQEIVAEVHNRRQEARRLRAEAETEWKAAKQHFETQLLGGE